MPENKKLTAPDWTDPDDAPDLSSPDYQAKFAAQPVRRGRPKKETTKVPIGFRLAADVVESLKASGPGYNARVEQALRKAGFGASKTKPAKKAETDTVRLTRNVEPAAKKREAHWKNFHAAGAGFRAHGSHGFAGAKKSAAKRSVKKTARRR